MVGKLWRFCIFVSIILTISGCTNAPLDTRGKVISPRNKTAPLQGKWKVEKCITYSQVSGTENQDSSWIGKTAEFAEKTAVLGEYIWEDVNYKIKRVNAEEYFMYKFKGSVNKLGIDDKEVYVITVASADKFLYEFVKISEDEVLANIEEEFLYLKKVSDEVDGEIYKEAKDMYTSKRSHIEQEDKLLRSGLLLGIRTPVKAEGRQGPGNQQEYNYRTLWIASENRNLHPVLEADDLFLPRKSGFWKLEVRKSVEDEWTEDFLCAYSITEGNLKVKPIANKSPDKLSDRKGVMHRVILYAGNDYVSVESSGSGKFKNRPGTWQENRLQTLPIDNLSNSEGIKISDIAGENGTLALESALSNLLSDSNIRRIKEIGGTNNEESFALFRKTGHWFIKGRISFYQEDGVPYLDYNINLIPPSGLVAYDVLHLPWTRIKDRVPQATDAYTSPGRDMAIILSRGQLLIYALNDGKLSDTPLKKVRLREGDSVVMAEWATGNYVEKWEKSFIENNKVKEATFLSN